MIYLGTAGVLVTSICSFWHFYCLERSCERPRRDPRVVYGAVTDIKEASFWGDEEQAIITGSDDGNIVMWDRRSGNIILVAAGDSRIVNCVQVRDGRVVVTGHVWHAGHRPAQRDTIAHASLCHARLNADHPLES